MKYITDWEKVGGMKYITDWEKVGDTHTYRLKVPGGWLVCAEIRETEGNATSMCFLPDPTLQWNISE